MRITKTTNEAGYDVIKVETNEGSFSMSFQANMDLYWSYNPKGSIMKSEQTKTFTINKDDLLYDYIFKVYDSIIKGKPYLYNNLDLDKDMACDNRELVKDGIIEWHSDEGEFDKTSVLYIKKVDNSFKITFKKGIVDMFYITYSVRFRMSGSAYGKFSYTFQMIYDELRELDSSKLEEKRNISNNLTNEQNYMIIDFYNKFDSLARFVSNSERADYWKPDNIGVAIQVAKSFINVIRERLYNSLDSATVSNLRKVLAYWLSEIKFSYYDEAIYLRELLNDISHLMYDLDNNIVGDETKKK